MDRPSQAVYYMGMAYYVSARGTCPRRHVGCVLVDHEGGVISTGYNGASKGKPHCTEVGCLMHNGGCVRTTHAEANAIGQAAKRGRPTDGCIAYVTTHPCMGCLTLLIAAGCMKVVYGEEYHADKDAITAELADGAIEIVFGPIPLLGG